MTQETPNGFFYICLPDETLSVCKEIAKKTGMSVGDVISQAVREQAEKYKVPLR